MIRKSGSSGKRANVYRMEVQFQLVKSAHTHNRERELIVFHVFIKIDENVTKFYEKWKVYVFIF